MERLVERKAPYFIIEAVSGDSETFLEISLDDYKGKWLVLFFYPLDFTFVCPTEITAFSEKIEAFKALNCEILGISTDSIYSHQAWIRNGLGKINFPLGSDKTQKLSDAFGVLLEDEGITLRGAFIINPEQTVKHSVIHDNNIGRNIDEILRVLTALQSNSLCASNWTSDSEPLKPPVTKRVYNVSNIEIYTLPNCSYCKQVKEYLRENNHSFTEINLETDHNGQEFMNHRGYRNLPVTIIGSREIEGFRLDLIKEILENAN